MRATRIDLMRNLNPLRFEFLNVALILLWATPMARAFIPIHPDASNVEEIQQWHAESMRKTPIATEFIHPQICHDVGAVDCQLMEDEFRSNARRLKEIVQSKEKVHALVLLIKFSDHVDRKVPKRGEYTTLFNSIGHSSERIPSGSVHEYLSSQSYGGLDFTAHVEDWRVTNNTEAHFSEGKHGVSHELRYMMYPVLDAMDEEGFDFNQFDSNGDGLIDVIFLLTSSYPAEVGGIDCYGQNFPNRIWAHAIAHPSFQWESSRTGIKANGYAVSSALRGLCGSVPLGMAVLMHEFGHLLELPDLRQPDANGPTEGQWIGFGSGHYDVMSDGHGLGGGSYPSSYSPWSKLHIGWLRPTEITENGEYSIEAFQEADDVYVIKKGFPEGEFLLIENRQAIMWDRHMWTGGILIWHIDEKKGNLYQRDRGHPGQLGWPGNGKHNRVALMQADGNYDLEVGANQGHKKDFWHADSSLKELGPGPARQEAFSNEYWQYPNTDAYQAGVITSTGIRIYDFSPSGPVMTFRVSGLPTSPTSAPQLERPSSSPSELPVPSLAPTPNPSASPTTAPTENPTQAPTKEPSPAPSWEPTYTLDPSAVPSLGPTTVSPSAMPSSNPSAMPSVLPSESPSALPSMMPSMLPSAQPSTLAPSKAGDADIPNLTTLPTRSPSTAEPPTESLSSGSRRASVQRSSLLLRTVTLGAVACGLLL